MHREDTTLELKQLFNGRARLGFHRQRQVWKRRDVLAEIRPAFGRMFKAKLGHRFSRCLQDEDIVMLFRPVKTGEVCDLLPCVHNA